MTELKFSSISDIGIFFLTIPGHLYNLLKSLVTFIVIDLPLFLWGVLQWLWGDNFFDGPVGGFPVIVYKFGTLVWTKVWSLLVGTWQYLTHTQWSWNSLYEFPNLPDKIRTEFIDGINQPFAFFAGGYSLDIKGGVRPLINSMNDLRDFIDFLPWPIFFAIVLLGVWALARKWSVVILGAVALSYIGFFNLMEPASQTLSLMVLSIVICVIIGIPLGILMSRSDAVEAAVKPVLDIMQTMPSFVYLIPVLILFGVSPVAGLIAVFIYAAPPVVRLTNLGIRLVPFDVVEASHAFGSTYIQRLFGVLIPLALPNIFAGINQTIMMALAMVVIAALVGAPGLGADVLSAQGNVNLARGLISGTAIALIAIVIDRSLHLLGERMQEHRKVGH